MVHQNSKIAATLEYSSLFNTGFFFQPSDELAFFEASIDLDRLTVRVEELGRASCRVCVSPAMNHDTRSN